MDTYRGSYEDKVPSQLVQQVSQSLLVVQQEPLMSTIQLGQEDSHPIPLV
jgi:hypothetical protein